MNDQELVLKKIVDKLVRLFNTVFHYTLRRSIWKHSKFSFDCSYHPKEIWSPAFLEARIYNRSIFSVEIDSVLIVSNNDQSSALQLIPYSVRLKPDEFVKCTLSAINIFNSQERKLMLGTPPYYFFVILSSGSKHIVKGELDGPQIQSIYKEAEKMLVSRKSMDEMLIENLQKAGAQIVQKERKSN